jgi:hypothetical protein
MIQSYMLDWTLTKNLLKVELTMTCTAMVLSDAKSFVKSERISLQLFVPDGTQDPLPTSEPQLMGS